MRLAVFSGVVIVGAVAFACGSGGSGDGGGGNTASAGDVASVCQASCDWRSKCGKGSAGCVTDCDGETTGYQGKWSAAYTGGVTSCFSALACDKKDDDCVADFSVADPSYPDIAEVKACLAKREECAMPAAGADGGTVEGNAFSDDYCQSIAALTDAAKADANRCLSRTCTEIRDCLKTAGAFSF